MVDLHLVLPALNLSSLDAVILIMMQQVKIDDVLTEHGGLLYVLTLTVHLDFFYGQVGGTFLKLSYSLGLFVGPLLHALKLGGGWVVVASSILVSAQGPLVLGLELRGLGLRVWGQGLTIINCKHSI